MAARSGGCRVQSDPEGLVEFQERLQTLESQVKALRRTKRLDPFTDLDDIGSVKTYLEFETPVLMPEAARLDTCKLFAEALSKNDSLTPGTDKTGLYYRRNDGLMTKISDDFPYSQKTRYVSQDDEPAFENSWVNYGGVYRQAHFIKDLLGCVWVTGLVKSGTIGANDIFDLPESYRNTGGSLRWATISNGALGVLDYVSHSPEAAVGNNTYFSLARMAFPETSRITWHAVGGAGEPAFENSWVNLGAGYDSAGFAKDAIGRVWIKGMAKDGNPTTVFTLPAGYRPSATITLPIETSANVIGKLTISAAGAVDVHLLGAGTNGWATITCVFQADGAVPWHEVGDTDEPAFENSWVNFGGAIDTAAFVKDAAGIVHIKGAVKSGTVGQAVFTLPVGYRPRSREIASVISNDAIGFMEVLPDGQVIASAGNNAWFTIHLAFVAEQ